MLDYAKLSMVDLLDRQQGVLTREQAVGAGLSRHAIAARVDTGRWQRLYRGVFVTFSGPIPRAALLWAAVLRAGDQAVLSHHTAAELWKLTDAPAPSIHVSVPRNAGPLAAPGLVVHYSVRLAATRHPARLPPQTMLEDTVLDLADLSATAENGVAWPIKACQRRLSTPDKIVDALGKRNRIRWRGDLVDALAETPPGVHSPLELRYFRDVERKHGLPSGDRQVLAIRGLRRQYLDVHYSDYGVIVELDGVSAHLAEARQQDVRRDNANTLAGHQTLRYGWIPVAYHPCEVTLEVAHLLWQRGWRGALRPCGKACPLSTLKVQPAIAGPISSTNRSRNPSRR